MFCNFLWLFLLNLKQQSALSQLMGNGCSMSNAVEITSHFFFFLLILFPESTGVSLGGQIVHEELAGLYRVEQ